MNQLNESHIWIVLDVLRNAFICPCLIFDEKMSESKVYLLSTFHRQTEAPHTKVKINTMLGTKVDKTDNNQSANSL